MRCFRQTLPGFIIGYMKNLYNNKVFFDDLVKVIEPFRKHLRKADGETMYSVDMQKSLKSSLYCQRLFIKDHLYNWSMDVVRCREFEAKATKCDNPKGFDKCTQ